MALTDQALAQLSDVKSELGISGSSDDARLTRMIEAVSEQITKYCRRKLYFTRAAAVAEKVAGFGENNLTVARTPIVAITSIASNGAAINSDAYEIGDADAGLIYRQDGWNNTASYLVSASLSRYPGSEDKSYTVTYTGGYVTANQGVLDNSLTRTLPYDLEDACIRMVATRYLSKGRDLNLASEKIGQAAETYRSGASDDGSGQGIPSEIRSVLNGYRRGIELA